MPRYAITRHTSSPPRCTHLRKLVQTRAYEHRCAHVRSTRDRDRARRLFREADRRSFMIRTINCEYHENKREHASRMRRDNQREESKRAAFAMLHSRRCIDDRPGSIEKLKVRELADRSLKVQESQSGFPASYDRPIFASANDSAVIGISENRSAATEKISILVAGARRCGGSHGAVTRFPSAEWTEKKQPRLHTSRSLRLRLA